MRMLGNRVLLEKVETENVSKGGILLTQPEKERTCVCKVLAVGPEVCQIEEGEKVLVDTYKLIKINDNYYCDFADVIGIVE